MDKKTLRRLICYIIFQVMDLDGYTTTIRLVKFLYLIDLEHYRRYGRLLTGLNWVYHLYGPYAFELQDIGESIGYDLKREVFYDRQRRKGVLFRVYEPQVFPTEIGHSNETMINGLLEVWALQETSDILDYTYQTEPMLNSLPGKMIDFSTTPIGTKYYELNVSINRNVTKSIRENLDRYIQEEETEYVIPRIEHNDNYFEGIQALEESESSRLDFPGVSFDVNNSDLTSTLPKGN